MEKHINDICFLVDIDYTYIQVVLPRVRWLRPLGYELDVYQASAAITKLLAEEMDKNAMAFGTYDVVGSKVGIDLKTATIVKKKDKMVKKIKKKLVVEETSTIGEAEEISNDEEEVDEEKGEERNESAKEEEAEEPPIKDTSHSSTNI